MKPDRLLALAVIVVASVGLAALADRLGGLTGVDALRHRTLDWRQTTTATSYRDDPRPGGVTLVLFDALAVTDPEFAWPWEQPFPRAQIADVVEAVAAAGARTIGLDVHLERLYPVLNTLDGGDDRLMDAMARAGTVVLAAPVVATDSGPTLGRPHPAFASVAAGVGAAELPTAFETVRDGALAVRADGGLAPSFALAVWAHAMGVDTDTLLAGAVARGRVDLPGLPDAVGAVPPSWARGDARASSVVVPFTLRYHGPPSSADASDPEGTFPAVSSATIAFTAAVRPELFRDRIVLVGSGFHASDRFRTPFFGEPAPAGAGAGGQERSWGWMYGVEVHANAVQDMLEESWVRPLAPGAHLALLLLAALLAGGVVFRKGAVAGGVTVALLVGGLAVVGFWTWAGRAYGPWGPGVALGRPFLWFPIVVPSLAAVVSYVGSVAWVSVVEGREKRFIRSAFGKYVSPEVVAEITEHPERLRLGGQKRTLSILFSDLAGFTDLAEHMEPEHLLARLNDYLSDMTRIVLDEGGTLDKYIGDAVMAFWNAPTPVADHADRAIRAAILMQRHMEELDRRWRTVDPDARPFVARIGVNTGPVVVGNVGGAERFDYSAIGDAVNLAARLEPANKTYGTRILVADDTLAAARRSAFRVREIDRVAVKGREAPVAVFEVLEMADRPLPPHRDAAVRHFEAGLAAYRARDWSGAAARFERALQADPADGPSGVYLGRARDCLAHPPPADWDFVVRRTTK